MATAEYSKAFLQGFSKGFVYSIEIVLSSVWASTVVFKPVWIVDPSISIAMDISARIQNMAAYCNKHLVLITHNAWLTIPKMKTTLYLREFLVRAQPGIRLVFAVLPLIIVIKSMLTCLSDHTGAADPANSAVPSEADETLQKRASDSRQKSPIPNNKAMNKPEEMKAKVKIAYNVTSVPSMSSACRDDFSQKHKCHTLRSNHKKQTKVDPESDLSRATM